MIPFSPPHIDQKIIDEVTASLKSGWITTGPRVKKLEELLSEYVGVERVLTVNAATNGLELILRWFGVGEGDEVIVPAYTYCATANVVLHCGAKPVMVDVGDDLNIDVQKIRAAITEKTKAIIPVDVAGLPCDYDAIKDIVNDPQIRSRFSPSTDVQKQFSRIIILSDAAHSIGAGYKGKKSGSLADVSVFSFHAVKNLSTAEGGAICFNLPKPFDNQKVYDELRVLTLHGQSKDAMAKFNNIGQWEYDVIAPGYKMNMPDVLAAIGLIELQRYDEILNKRKHIFKLYNEAFLQYDWTQIPISKNEDGESSYHVYPLRILGIDEETRNKVIDKIFAEGVSVNVHFKPLPMLTAYKNLGYRIDDYPNAYNHYSREISLPVYYDLSDLQVNQVVDAVVKAVSNSI